MIHRKSTLAEFIKRIEVDVKDLELLDRALVHRSYLGEHPEFVSNERLEFLGDSVLGVVVAEYLYSQFPERSEGELSKAKALAVSEPVLASAAEELRIADIIHLSSGEDGTGGRERPSILSDAFEAIVGVIYLDCGLSAAREFILSALSQVLADIREDRFQRDQKNTLQEITQAYNKQVPSYVVTDEVGKDHDKTFTVEVWLEEIFLGRGIGKRKKQAERAAAAAALQRIQEIIAENEQGQTG